MSKKESKRGKIRLLLVEDSPTQAEKIKAVLQDNQYEVSVARDGKQALAIAREWSPRLLISDIVMPEVDGFELCKQFKADEQLKDVPVILVTALSGPQEVIRALESGADNFIRKPLDEQYLLQRIDYILANRAMRESERVQMGLSIDLGGKRHFITAERQQILDLLISTYEEAVRLDRDLERSGQSLRGLHRIAEGLNRAETESEVCNTAVERALELPGIQAGWMSLREGEAGFRLAAAQNLPPALLAPGALDGECLCRRRLIAGELDQVTNILECERLQKAKGDTRGLRFHASVPIWVGKRILGLMNLVGPEDGVFGEEDLQVLLGVGNQIGIALERARLLEQLESLVSERTRALKEAEGKYRSVFENAVVGIYRTTRSGRYLMANPTLARVLGYLGPEDMVESVTDLSRQFYVEPGRRAEFVRLAEQQGSVSDFESQVYRKDGSVIWISESARAIRDADGQLTGFDGTTVDVTQRRQAEEALRASERLLSLVYANVSDIIYYLSVEPGDRYRFLSINPAFFRATGLTESQVVGKLVQDVIPEPAHDLVLGNYKAAIRSKSTLSWEEISVYPTGEKHGEVSVTPIFDDQGQCTHLIGAVHDITERVKAEKATRESEEKFRTLSEKSPNMIFINQAGRVVYANEASEAIMGYSRAELTSSDFNFLTLIAPDSVERVKQNFQRHVRGEDIPPQEYQLVTRDGRRIDGIQSSRLVQYDGKPAILGIITDITDRKRAEERIREQADDLGLLNQLNDAINRGQPIEQIVRLLSEEAKRIFSVNDASVYLMSPDKLHLVLSVQGLSGEIVSQVEELLGRQIPTPRVALREGSLYLETLKAGKPTLIHEPDQIRRLIEEHTEDSILKGVVPQVQRVLKIGSVILLPLISEDEPIGLLAVSRDRPFTKEEVKRLEAVSAELTTTIKRKLGEDEIRRFNVELEQRVITRTAQLEAANKELESFSYSVSHDLRAPLRAIDGFSQALLEESAEQLGEAGQGYLRRVRAATQRMGTLIDDMLALSRVARLELHREKVALAELARAIATEFAEREPDRRVEFGAEGNFSVDGDPRLLRVALENLLGNAWKFTQGRAQATIEFGREIQDGSPVYYVRDNGAGFDMEYADKLFGAFQRLHPATEFPGTGVGLATVQRIIHRHGGRVWAEGKVDHGATFYFTVAPKGDPNG